MGLMLGLLIAALACAIIAAVVRKTPKPKPYELFTAHEIAIFEKATAFALSVGEERREAIRFGIDAVNESRRRH